MHFDLEFPVLPNNQHHVVLHPLDAAALPNHHYSALVTDGHVDIRGYLPAGRYAVVLDGHLDEVALGEVTLDGVTTLHWRPPGYDIEPELVVGDTTLPAESSMYLQLLGQDSHQRMAGGDILLPGRYTVRYHPPGANAPQLSEYPLNYGASLGCVTLEGWEEPRRSAKADVEGSLAADRDGLAVDDEELEAPLGEGVADDPIDLGIVGERLQGADVARLAARGHAKARDVGAVFFDLACGLGLEQLLDVGIGCVHGLGHDLLQGQRRGLDAIGDDHVERGVGLTLTLRLGLGLRFGLGLGSRLGRQRRFDRLELGL